MRHLDARLAGDEHDTAPITRKYDVGIEESLPLGVFDLGERLDAEDAEVVDQYIHAK